MIAFVGDVHGDFKELSSRMKSHTGIKEWVQVGDLGGRDTPYSDFPSHLSFISGNHENWNEIEKMDRLSHYTNLTHIPNGTLVEIDGIKILGFGGNYSSKFFEYPKDKLCQERRRHFVKEEFEEAIRIGTETEIDVLITHEAPSPYIKHWYEVERDMGISVITELIRKIKPKFHFFGHHHCMTTKEIGNTLSIGLGRSHEEIYVLGTETLELSYICKDKKIIQVPNNHLIGN